MIVGVLSRPRLGRGGRTLSFRLRRLTGRGSVGLRAFLDHADRRLPRSFGHVDLFIDSATGDTNVAATDTYIFNSTGPAKPTAVPWCWRGSPTPRSPRR